MPGCFTFALQIERGKLVNITVEGSVRNLFEYGAKTEDAQKTA